jgi:hypothetical protein
MAKLMVVWLQEKDHNPNIWNAQRAWVDTDSGCVVPCDAPNDAHRFCPTHQRQHIDAGYRRRWVDAVGIDKLQELPT